MAGALRVRPGDLVATHLKAEAGEQSEEDGSTVPAEPASHQSEPRGPSSEGATPVGPIEAVRQLFHTHYDSIWRLLRRLGVRQSQIDDAAQEVFWIAARKLGDIRHGREHAFLYGVALRIASQERRRLASAPAMVDDAVLAPLRASEPSPEEHLAHQEARALLDEVLDRMPPELRTVFVLCDLEELEVQEVARIEGVPVGTASSRLRRARQEFATIARRVRDGLIVRGGLP